MTVAPAAPSRLTRVTGGGAEPGAGTGAGRAGNGAGGKDTGGEDADLLDHLRSPSTPRPEVDERLAGGLRAWLEDGVAGRCGAVVVRDGAVVVRDGGPSLHTAPGPRRIGPAEIRTCLTRVLFRLIVTDGPPRHPFEDALCAISVTDPGAVVLDAVRRLRDRERWSLRATLRARAATMAAQWRPVPHTWLPRTGERLHVPLAGGAVLLSSTADLVLGRPGAGTASVCLVRVHEGRRGPTGAEEADRALRALALAETLRSGARPWRVASYDPSSGRLRRQDAGDELLVAGVRDVLRAVGSSRDRADDARVR